MTARAAILVLLFALAPLNQAASWGASGHSIIAEIAQRRLHPQVLARIKELLGGEISLASIANWADDVVAERPDTAAWHFVNIPFDAARYDPRRDCAPSARGDCVVNAIARSRATLADRSAPRHARLEALMFLVHLVGDAHQPLHAIDRDDAGGSRLAVTFFDKPMSLHAVWDTGIIEKRTYDWGGYVRDLERHWLTGKDIRTLQRGEPADWVWQAHLAAVNVAYVLPRDLKLGEAYYQRSLPVVDRQLALAGIRLARLLNESFGHGRFVARSAGRHRSPGT